MRALGGMGQKASKIEEEEKGRLIESLSSASVNTTGMRTDIAHAIIIGAHQVIQSTTGMG